MDQPGVGQSRKVRKCNINAIYKYIAIVIDDTPQPGKNQSREESSHERIFS